MMDNHYGELLLYVYRAASCECQDVASMDAMDIFCDRNYCVEFLDGAIRYCSKSENILARNLIS